MNATDLHQIRMETRAHYYLPSCTCGWAGSVTLSVRSAREESRTHMILASGDVLNESGEGAPAEPDPDA